MYMNGKYETLCVCKCICVGVRTSDKKYRFGVPFKVLSKLDYICSPAYKCHINVCMYVCI